MIKSGKVIDGYRIKELVGEGGFSEVYRVSPEKIEKQNFALKVVPLPEHVPLLEAEAQILAKLAHPKIPTPIKLGVFQNDNGEDCHYLLMDYVPYNLAKILEQDGPLSLESACHIVKQILDLLNYAHGRGVVHKDLKPGNIGLDQANNVHLLDFNIAQSLLDMSKDQPHVQHSSVHSDIIQVGQIQKSIIGGTEGYASPEQRKLQVEGKIFPVDLRSDIYSLGVLFYHLLVGHLPQGNYRRPSNIKKELPKWVDYVIDKALDPNPELRYANATEMALAIEAGLNGQRAFSVTSALRSVFTVPFAILKHLLLSPVYLLKGVVALYSGQLVSWLGQRNSNLATLATIFTILLWLGTVVVPPVYYFQKIDKDFEAEFSNSKLSGTIVFHKGNKLAYFKADDLFKESVSLHEVSSPATITMVAHLQKDQFAWIASEDAEDANRKNNAVYIGSLRDGHVRRIADNMTTIKLRKGFFARTPLEITDIRACPPKIFLKMENGQWFSLSDEDSTGIEEKAPAINSGLTNISPDGLLRVVSGLKVERNSDKWGSRSLAFSGRDPLWVPFDLDVK